MNRVVRTTLASVAVAAGVSAGLGGTAWAAGNTTNTTVQGSAAGGSTPSSLSAIQAQAAKQIQSRLDTLNNAVAKVSGNRWLTSLDRATILSLLQSDISGLTAVGGQIQSATSASQAQSEYKDIFLDYRVYALVVPKARMAAASDEITGSALPRLNDANARLTALLQGRDASKDTPTVKADMTQLASNIQTVTNSTSGLSAQILSFTPTQFNANHDVLSSTRQTLETARSEVLSARAEALQVMAALQ